MPAMSFIACHARYTGYTRPHSMSWNSLIYMSFMRRNLLLYIKVGYKQKTGDRKDWQEIHSMAPNPPVGRDFFQSPPRSSSTWRVSYECRLLIKRKSSRHADAFLTVSYFISRAHIYRLYATQQFWNQHSSTLFAEIRTKLYHHPKLYIDSAANAE